jgi:outer membrane biosynthesis protein TonB
MSRPTYRQTAGAVFAVVALVLGITAAAALSWGGEGGSEHGNAHGKKDHGSKQDTGKKQTETTPPKTETTPPKTETTPPPTVTTLAPPPTVTTTATTPPTTVTTQERPPSRTTTETTTVATTTTETTTTAPPLKPVAKRKQLAATGLSPVLMVLLGVGLLGGGAFVLRRSLLQR